MKFSFLTIFTILLSFTAFSQHPDSLNFDLAVQDSNSIKKDRKWFIPNHAVIQFAGNIGKFSAGPGYTFFDEKLQADLLLGIAPGNELQKRTHILTAKFTYNPYQLDLGKKLLIEPLRVGSGVSYHFGDQFHTQWPGRYPDGYYTWQTRYRILLFAGSAINLKIGDQDKFIKRIQLYGEAGTYDFDFVNYVRDGWVSAWDIISFAVGTKIVL